MEKNNESFHLENLQFEKNITERRFIPAITLPCSSNAAWEVVMAVLFLGGRRMILNTQYSVCIFKNISYICTSAARNVRI